MSRFLLALKDLLGQVTHCGDPIQAFGGNGIQVLVLTPTSFQCREGGIEQRFQIALMEVEGLPDRVNEIGGKSLPDLIQPLGVLEKLAGGTESPKGRNPGFTRLFFDFGRTRSNR
ncbi:hypothetical protein D3C75_981240 [compost metagenome]